MWVRRRRARRYFRHSAVDHTRGERRFIDRLSVAARNREHIRVTRATYGTAEGSGAALRPDRANSTTSAAVGVLGSNACPRAANLSTRRRKDGSTCTWRPCLGSAATHAPAADFPRRADKAGHSAVHLVGHHVNTSRRGTHAHTRRRCRAAPASASTRTHRIGARLVRGAGVPHAAAVGLVRLEVDATTRAHCVDSAASLARTSRARSAKASRGATAICRVDVASDPAAATVQKRGIRRRRAGAVHASRAATLLASIAAG